MRDDLSELRSEYDDSPLTATAVGTDPMRAFAAWFDDATNRSAVVEPNACALATSTPHGVPSVRMVLLKQVDPARAAFAIYTNLTGRKATEALATGHASLCWWWPGEPARQFRVAGRVEPVDRVRAAEYFASRPLAARIGAAASEQSRAIAGRAELDERAAAIDPERIELPDTWGGLWVVADELELWQGRAGRMHDRITFLRLGDDDQPRATAAVAAAGGSERLTRCGQVVVDPHGTRWMRARLAP